ncbi:hypothetical protein DVH24_005016 [Malus domestica]|uniref:RNase H type-1 domain-containing protein n=1 Tax=Malus domestica TaxID=3750 RepID=A0A498IG25_MALDO|nr:hypothetical protein DVH24_005016 [Malus domestica]
MRHWASKNNALEYKSRRFKKICVEGDSKLVIDNILGSYNVPSLLKIIIKDIKNLAASLI